MSGSAETTVSPLRLDRTEECLWRGREKLRLTPKAFAVLGYLVDHAPHLVKKDDLLSALWPDVYVSDAALTVCIREIRKALGDDAQTPRYVETVHRRGFRFIGGLAAPETSSKADTRDEGRRGLPVGRLVGRAGEIEALESRLEKASKGDRQIFFVSGEPGIGKTALVDTFAKGVSAAGKFGIARGQCIEQYGAGEPYLPVLQALGQLCRGSTAKRVIELVTQHAPSWLLQMPSLVAASELDVLQRQHHGVSRERMLREFGEFVEALTVEAPLVLVLEDLHWSDYSTLDVVSLLAQRREAARLLLIGTYRPVDMIVRGHPLRAVREQLQRHGQSTELPLQLLSAAAVAEYLALKLGAPGSRDPHLEKVASLIHRRTEGSPLFTVHVVDDWLANGVIAEKDGGWQLARELKELETNIPQGLREMIEREAQGLSLEEQRLLETASVAGQEFSAAAVAAGMSADVVEVEECCEALARREEWLVGVGIEEWPDGTVAGRYGFLHALYREVLYQRVSARRRVELHLRIGERQEAAHGENSGDVAAELAMHFERGRDFRRGAQYHLQAAEAAIRRSAHAEAIVHLRTGLQLLGTQPGGSRHVELEIALLVALGVSLVATNGYSSTEVRETFARARELCIGAGETPRLFTALFGLWLFYVVRPDLPSAEDLAKQLLVLGEKVADPALLVEAHYALGATRCFMGDFASARDHTDDGIRLYDRRAHRSHAFLYGQDPAVVCMCYSAWALWHLGYPDQGLKRIEEALTLAHEMAHPFSVAFALIFAALFHQFRREPALVERFADSAITVSAKLGFRDWWTWASILRGWAVAERGQEAEAIAQIQEHLVFFRSQAQILLPSALAWSAMVYRKIGQAEQGLGMLDEALATATRNGDLMHEAELYRLKGEFLLDPSNSANPPEAESYFRRAIDIARKQDAKSLELRAATSLSRLWQRQGKNKQARKLLTEIYQWFTEGFDTADLKDAKRFLVEFSARQSLAGG